jgi:hypothetical protein
MLSGCHNHYAYEPQYGDAPGAGDTSSEKQKPLEDSFKTFERLAPAIAHKKIMYSKEGEPLDM